MGERRCVNLRTVADSARSIALNCKRMELEVFDAFRAAGVPDDKASGAVGAINDLIDGRYSLHAEKLATREDVAGVRADLERLKGELRSEIAEARGETFATRGEVARVRAGLERVKGELRSEIAAAKGETIRWCVGSIFASVAMFAAITKLLTH